MKINVLLLLLFLVFSLRGQSPGGIDGEDIWFTAEKHLTRTRMADSTAIDTLQAQSNDFNFHQALVFDGNSGIKDILSADLHNVKKITAYLIYKNYGAPQEQPLWSLQTPTLDITLTTDSITSFKRSIPYTGGRTDNIVINRYYEKWKRLPEMSVQRDSSFFYLGSTETKDSLSKKFKGGIAEFILYNRKLKPKERAVLETYLALRYGVTMNGDYVDSGDQKIWNVEDNDPYLHRISGIGRDDKANIFQKQSGSSDDQGSLVICAGSLQLSNELNTSSMNHGDFLIWGDDNGKNEMTEALSNSLPVLDRKWLLQASGETCHRIKTEVCIDPHYFFPNTVQEENDYILVIDRKGSGNFEQTETEIVYAEPDTTRGTQVFRNIVWDIDKSGNDSFTFAMLPKLRLTLQPDVKTDCESTTKSETITYSVTGGLPPYSYELINTTGNHQKQWKDKENENSVKEGVSNTSEAGLYRFTVTDVLAHTTKDTLTIEAYVPLQIDLGEDRALADASITLDAATLIKEKSVTYLWQSDQGLSYNTPKIEVKEAGTYTVTATDSYSCTATDEITIFPSIIEQFVIYPNVSKDGSYTVQVALKEPSPGLKLDVYDLQGQLQHTQQTDRKNTYFEFRGKVEGASGLYTIHISSSTITATGKFIKE
ncbi:T9SS type A sorting domain-containing protein [Aquimarina sp. U1-2]|uniref:T9SS type A sorting domain-containing protein n=1 Tax=Aquimarina sp. U1-2 TaxID=2823141 RepID=UPI001AECEDEE|nr:T9SS type A sorting domain-containing protein [Aquimarina sp. U1-2]MBP2833460.1 T9SS type A sorting domain-containing protein [Aquimarina sp. U1-2]